MESIGEEEEKKKKNSGGETKKVLLKVLSSSEEEYFKDKLGEDSEDFLYMKKLVKEMQEVSWKKLAEEEVVEIVDGKIKAIEWKRDLMVGQLKGIKKLTKFKRIDSLHMNENKELEDLGDLEYVDNLYAKNSALKKADKLTAIPGWLWCQGTNIEFQLDIIDRINEGKIKFDGGFFGGNVEGIEKIKKAKKIPGNLLLEDVEMEDLGEIEEVEGYIRFPIGCKKANNLKKIRGELDVRYKDIDFQIHLLKRVNAGLLEEGGMHLGGLGKEMLRFLEFDFIPGLLDVEQMDIEDQFKIYDKVNKKQLKIEGILDADINRITYFEGRACGLTYYKLNEGLMFPRIGIDTNLEDKDIQFWVGVLKRVSRYSGEEYELVQKWIAEQMKEYYLESIEEYKVNGDSLGHRGEKLEKLKKEKDSFFQKIFPDVFSDNIKKMSMYRKK